MSAPPVVALFAVPDPWYTLTGTQLTVVAGTTTTLAAQTDPVVNVAVAGRSANLATTVALPTVVVVNQQFYVKDIEGNATTYHIAVTHGGVTLGTIATSGGDLLVTWDGEEWTVV